MCTLLPLVLSLRRVDILSLNTVSRGCFSTFRGRRLVPGGLDVPALDRNQSPLLLLFHLAFLLLHSPSTPHKGGDPRQELTNPSLSLNFPSVLPTCAYPASVHSAGDPPMLTLPARTSPCPLCHATRSFAYYLASPLICNFYLVPPLPPPPPLSLPLCSVLVHSTMLGSAMLAGHCPSFTMPLKLPSSAC
jgi:hypothetical protein